MFFGYVGDSVRIDPEKFGFGPVPSGPTGERGAEINAQIPGIFSGITDPAVRDAAWKYIKFISSEDAERIRIETLVEMGLAGQVNPIYLRKFGFDQYLRLLPPDLEDAFQEAEESGKPESYGRNFNLVYNEMTSPLDQILLSPEIAELWQAGKLDQVREVIAGILKTAVIFLWRELFAADGIINARQFPNASILNPPRRNLPRSAWPHFHQWDRN